MSAYWLGVLTTPCILIAFMATAHGVVRVLDILERNGFTFEAKGYRGIDRIEDYTLRRDIWWERTFGPVFVGGWCFDRPDGLHVHRWIGVGRDVGPAVMAFRTRTQETSR